AVVVGGQDVGVVEAGHDLRLAMEALAPGIGMRRLRQQRLEGHVAVQRRLEGFVDDAHPAPAEELDALVRTELLPLHEPVPSGTLPHASPSIRCSRIADTCLAQPCIAYTGPGATPATREGAWREQPGAATSFRRRRARRWHRCVGCSATARRSWATPGSTRASAT